MSSGITWGSFPIDIVNQDTSIIGNDTTIYKIVEQMPIFGDCSGMENLREIRRCSDKNLIKAISRNLRFEPIIREMGYTPNIFCRFIIEKDGTTSNFEFIKNEEINSYCNIQKIVDSLQWKPGIRNNQKVRVQLTLPIRITLSE
ncbi:MAG: energy transducer TonB [Saprospiraceae bacterium]